MNKSIRFTALFALILSLVLLVNLTIIQAFSDDKYADNPNNRRAFIEAKTSPRGQISAGGQVLARSYQDENGFFQREYVTNPAAYGPVEGYLSDIYGAAGIESGMNDVLTGNEVGAKQVWKQLISNEKQVGNVELTLLPSVQEVAYEQLSSNNYEGAVVALRPSTGEVLAMASTPTYNPARIVDPAGGQSAWEEYTNNPANPLLNKATQESLPPGSTFKVVTTAAALNKGYGPGSMLTGAPQITLPGTTTTLENYGGSACAGGGQVTLATAFALSCNTAFVEMAIGAGGEALRDAANAFGVSSTYDLGIPMVGGTLGEINDDPALGQSAIGQRDVAMTVLHNAVVAATVANKGKRMEPYLVSKVTGDDLSVISERKPRQLNEALDEDVANTLTELMRGSERSTAGYAGQDIASKTGTAEHGEDSGSSDPHTWYIAFGPSAEADVAVAVLVKNGGNMGPSATGGAVAAPIGRAVIAAAQQALAQQDQENGGE